MATIDLPYIERNRSRHGRMRYYFRLDGIRERLPDDPTSEAFTKAYWSTRNRVESASKLTPGTDSADPLGLPRPGTFRWLCVAYLTSEAFKRLDATTQAKRRAIIHSMLIEPVKPVKPGENKPSKLFADMPISALDQTNIEVLRDRKQATPFAADERLKVLRQVFETTKPGTNGKPEKLVAQNVARQVQAFRLKTDGHHTINNDEIAQYIKFHGPASKAVLALVILMYTGVRVSDAQALGPQHRRGNQLIFRVFKGRKRNPVTLDVPIHPILDGVLAMHPLRGLRYLVTEYGKPFSIKGLSQRISEWFNQAGLPHCTAHTVRKGLATTLAESEATDSMLDGMFGWKDGKTSKIYTARKQQAKLARQAVSRIDWGDIGNVLPHPEPGVASQAATPEKNTG